MSKLIKGLFSIFTGPKLPPLPGQPTPPSRDDPKIEAERAATMTAAQRRRGFAASFVTAGQDLGAVPSVAPGLKPFEKLKTGA